MRLNDNSKFIFLTVGVFCLALGAAVLLLSLIERVFLSISITGWFVELSLAAIVLGAMLLRCGRRTPDPEAVAGGSKIKPGRV
ncbi:MAG TPA: hypothetical protein VJ302_03460 [Blastocatellia bacterium]|nr:hypothetical protein [Blastocatellia bacterium]